MNAKNLIPVAIVIAAIQFSAFAQQDAKPAAEGQEQEQPQAAASTNTIPKSTVVLTNRMDKICYCMGVDMASMLRLYPDMNKEYVVAGVRDVLDKRIPAVSPQELSTLLEEFNKEVHQREAEEGREKARKNKEEGAKFLTKNMKKEGVKTLASGLQYEVLKEGSGAMPTTEDTVVINIVGSLVNGREFMNTIKKGSPYTTPIRHLIPGWKEALLMMKTGSKWKLYVPTELAWGERDAGRNIPANSALITELELVSIVQQEKKQ